MVKSISKIFLPVFYLCNVCLIIGCNVDLSGLFGSTDLDERLEEKDNFRYLVHNERERTFTDNFSFIVLTDTHVENGNIQDLEKLKTVINSDVQFVAILGDITQNGAEQDVKKVVEFTRTLSVPCYPVIGNHDIFFGNWSVWKKYIGATRYRIDGENVTLFILDSANLFIGKAQLDWLEKELKTAKGKVFVFTHVDFFVQDKKIKTEQYDTAERARFMSILRDKCSIVFTGHSHDRGEKEFGGVKYISIEDYKRTQTYCLVKVTPAGVSYEFKKR